MTTKTLKTSFQTNKPLRELSTFGIGGPARYFVEVHTVDEMRQAFIECNELGINFLVIGKGSNCLFDDRGFDGLVILNKIDFMKSMPNGQFHVGAGYSFSLLGTQTARQGWSGLEFASGIPGTVGGAVFMNAGANGHETCESLHSVDYLDERGAVHCIPRKDLEFSYRTSPFQRKLGAILGATFILKPSSEARQKQIGIITYRTKTQPYGEKSAGCIFRNPCCGFAGALIEQAGLKGEQIGGAKVSEVHGNFIVNVGGATADEVRQLIRRVRERIKAFSGIDLESEVREIPYSSEGQEIS